LENKDWKEFELGKLFKPIISGKSKGLNHLIKINKGGVNYLGATNLNNGVICQVSENKELIQKGNCISFIRNGEGSMGYSVYKSEDFIATSDISSGYNSNLNKYNGMFITTVSDRIRGKYNFGYKRSDTRLKKEKLILPIDSNGEPDYKYMETFMRQKEQEKIKAYKEYASKRLKELGEIKKVDSLSEKEWEEFFVNDIFDEIQRGKRLKKDDHEKGIIPYASSTAMNNGIDNWINNSDDVRIFNNCLSLANSGSVGACFFQPFNFVASDHITKLANAKFNKYVYLFISITVSRLGEKYSFNREINDTRIKREKIILPTNKNKEPDYEYMENYMKKIEFNKLKNYLDYINKR
jgi:hypothetical protein